MIGLAGPARLSAVRSDCRGWLGTYSEVPRPDSLVVRLQKQLSRRFRGKNYAKWVVVLPPRVVGQLGWQEGQVLKYQVNGRTLRLRPVWKGQV